MIALESLFVNKRYKSLEKIASFEALQTITVTGAVFTPPLFEWTQMAFGKDVQLISTSGGTDIHTSCQLFILSDSLTGSKILYL